MVTSSAVAPPPRLAPLILLVDDSPEDTLFYAGHLMAAGFRVKTATTGGEAVALGGFHGTATVMRAICAGCCAFEPKPCSAEQLEATVRATLESAKRKT